MATNPIVASRITPEQYRLAQAVLSGTARATGMPKAIAREIVDKTPAAKRSEFSQNPERYEVVIGPRTRGRFQTFEEARKHGADQQHHGVHARFKVRDTDTGEEVEFSRSGSKANPFWKKTTSFSSKLMKGAYDAGYKGVHGVRGDPEFDQWLKRTGEKNLDPSFEAKLRAEYWRGAEAHDQRTEAAGTFKGHKIEKKAGEYIVPSIDRESRFESLAKAKEFIAANPHVYYITKGNHVKAGPFYSRAAAKDSEDYKTGDQILTIEQVKDLARSKRNPSGTAASMYESFHGKPSRETVVLKREEHYHEHTAALGACCGVVVETVFNKQVAIGLSGYEWDPREKSPVRSLHGAFVLADSGAEETLLSANEDGTQLFLDGGDQALDLEALGFDDAAAEKESVFIGDITHVAYETSKKFDGKDESAQYVHEFSEDSHGPLPVLRYDRVNQQLFIDGGVYKIPQPLVGTSPGIVD